MEPPPWLLGMEAALAFSAVRMSASWGYVGSPWIDGRDGVGKLSMSVSGDGVVLDGMLTYCRRAWLAPDGVLWHVGGLVNGFDN